MVSTICFISFFRLVLSPRQLLVSFLDMLSLGLDAMPWNPRDSISPFMFSFMRSPPLFLNLIHKPAPRENGDGVLFINSHLMIPAGSASLAAQHADCQPVQRIPVTRHSTRRRLHDVSQTQTTPEDQQSRPVWVRKKHYIRFVERI